MDRDRACFLIEHLFLPPKLPHVDHEELGADELLKQVSRLARVFSKEVSTDSARRVWTHLARSAERWTDLYGSGIPCISTITDSLKNMQIHGTSYLFHEMLTVSANHLRCSHVLCQVSKRHNHRTTSRYWCGFRMFRGHTQDRCCHEGKGRFDPKLSRQSRLYPSKGYENGGVFGRACYCNSRLVH